MKDASEEVLRSDDDALIIRATRRWLERAVIGLKLCPFARHPYTSDRVRYFVSNARTQHALRDDLQRELQWLIATDAAVCETALLIIPGMLAEFSEYNEFLGECDDVLGACDLEGELQIASFHPQYQFAHSSAGDITNFTNRSPYPMLHLLREASVERGVAEFPQIDEIGSNNIQTMRELGHKGWNALWIADG